MCGIVGYVGPKAATPMLVAGLRKLEYRGYDSAGLAVTDAPDDAGGPLPRQAVGARGHGARRSRRPGTSASATRAGRRTGGRPR